jgi:hypothetical protein
MVKKLAIYSVLIIATVAVTAAVTLSEKVQNLVEIKGPWQDSYAKAKGELGAVYGFPYVFNYFLLQQWGQPASGDSTSRVKISDTWNQFHHVRHLADASYRDGGSPNNDTAYSVAWLFVDNEPVIITAPAMDREDRYWSTQISSFTSDNYAYLGQRTTGMDGGNYAIVPPGWRGELPEGVTYLAESPTQWSLLLGRTLVDSKADLAAVHKIQDQYQLTALSDWGKAVHVRPPFEPVDNMFPKYSAMFADKSVGFKGVLTDFIKSNPERYLAVMNHAMTINGIPVNEQAYQQQFVEVGIGPGMSVDNIRLDFINGRNQGTSLGLIDIVKSIDADYGSNNVNGWAVLDASFGRAGVAGDFLLRGGMQSLGGIVANDLVEASYFLLNDDVNFPGIQQPHGSNDYTIHFSKEQLPEVEAFWSLSVYDDTNNLVANAMNRYSIGDRTEGIIYSDDGGITLSLSHKMPVDIVARANWVPIPEAGFYMVFRTYLPGQSIVDQRWTPPKLLLQ